MNVWGSSEKIKSEVEQLELKLQELETAKSISSPVAEPTQTTLRYALPEHLPRQVERTPKETQFNLTPEAYKEREVPVPDKLLEAVGVDRKKLPAKRAKAEALIFSTASGRPDTHMIRALKRNAKKAGLNRDDFWLHK
jgi:hypothetical protein